jgi:hypothetical protein
MIVQSKEGERESKVVYEGRKISYSYRGIVCERIHTQVVRIRVRVRIRVGRVCHLKELSFPQNSKFKTQMKEREKEINSHFP